MNYQNIYDNLISRGQTREPLTEYKEIHHIIPRCMGGTDEKTNLVELTAREHFIAHLLLCKINPGHFGLVSALTLMATDKAGNRINNKLYSFHRKLFAKANSEFFKEHWKNNPHPRGMLGKHHSEESKQIVSEKNRLAVPSTEIYQFTLDGEFVEKFRSLQEAARSVGGCTSNIKYCASGKFQYAYGFRWSYSLQPTFDKITPRQYKGARGKICINDGFTNKLIESSEIIPNGWVRGRIKVNK
ncbi:homing endonuclease [Yersinia phage vB_YenM_P8]